MNVPILLRGAYELQAQLLHAVNSVEPAETPDEMRRKIYKLIAEYDITSMCRALSE